MTTDNPRTQNQGSSSAHASTRTERDPRRRSSGRPTRKKPRPTATHYHRRQDRDRLTEAPDGPQTTGELGIHVSFPVKNDAAVPSGFATILVDKTVTIHELLTYRTQDYTNILVSDMAIMKNGHKFSNTTRLMATGVTNGAALWRLHTSSTFNRHRYTCTQLQDEGRRSGKTRSRPQQHFGRRDKQHRAERARHPRSMNGSGLVSDHWE